MKKRNLLKLLILFLTVTTSTVKTYATDAEQIILLSVPATVAVEKLNTSIDSANVTPATGTLDRNLITMYKITTNGQDEDYDFTVSSEITAAGDTTVSAYGQNGCILFAHTLNRPTLQAVNDAKAGGSNNPNVIAYPTSTSITAPMTSTYSPAKNCYVINTNNATEGDFTHTVSSSPFLGTYNVAQDEEGIYKSTIIISATPKN